MDIMLSRIYAQINGKRKQSITQIPEDRILLTQSDSDVDDYRFTCYFEATNGQGFGRTFFLQDQKCLSAGAKAFELHNLKISEVQHGEKAKTTFDGYKDHTKHNQATINYFERLAGRKESTAVILTDKSTIIDMKQDFWNKYVNNQVSSVRDYIRMLDENNQHSKKFDVLDSQPQFERILDYLHQEAISKQVKSDPIKTLK